MLKKFLWFAEMHCAINRLMRNRFNESINSKYGMKWICIFTRFILLQRELYCENTELRTWLIPTIYEFYVFILFLYLIILTNKIPFVLILRLIFNKSCLKSEKKISWNRRSTIAVWSKSAKFEHHHQNRFAQFGI